MKFCGNFYAGTEDEELEEWLEGKILSRPQATSEYTVEELEEMEVVGVYDPSREENENQ